MLNTIKKRLATLDRMRGLVWAVLLGTILVPGATAVQVWAYVPSAPVDPLPCATIRLLPPPPSVAVGHCGESQSSTGSVAGQCVIADTDTSTVSLGGCDGGDFLGLAIPCATVRVDPQDAVSQDCPPAPPALP